MNDAFVNAVRDMHGEDVARRCEELAAEAAPELGAMQLLAKAIASSGLGALREVNKEKLATVVFNSSFRSRYRDPPDAAAAGN